MKRFLVTLILIGIMATAVGCANENAQAKEKLQNTINNLQQQVDSLKAENKELKQNLAKKEAKEVTVYFIKSEPNDFFLVPEKRIVTATDNNSLINAALNELAKGPYANSNLTPSLPKGSKILSFKVEGDTATVDFNAATRDNLNVGSSVEALVLTSIANTVTEFPGIKQVQILIEGQKADSLAGHVEIDKPLTRNEKVIKK